VRLHHLLRSQLTLDVDVGWGATTATRVVDGGALGSASFDVDVSQWQLGTAFVWEQPLQDLVGLDVTAVVGPRMAGLLYVHRFVGDVVPQGLDQQTYLAFSPGLVAGLGWSFSSWGHLEVSGRAQYLPYTVDSLRHLAVVEGFATVWLDL
jgi:hypothetical protein